RVDRDAPMSAHEICKCLLGLRYDLAHCIGGRSEYLRESLWVFDAQLISVQWSADGDSDFTVWRFAHYHLAFWVFSHLRISFFSISSYNAILRLSEIFVKGKVAFQRNYFSLNICKELRPAVGKPLRGCQIPPRLKSRGLFWRGRMNSHHLGQPARCTSGVA